MADERKGVKKSNKNTGKEATKSRVAASSNRLLALDETKRRKCVICNDSVDENEFLFLCHYCSLYLFIKCYIDPDMPADVTLYLYSTNATDNFFCKCNQCSRQPYLPANTHIVNMVQLERRLATIENLLVCNRNVQPDAQILTPVITAPVYCAVSTDGNFQRQSTVHNEIFEELEQEKRKCNLILYNMSATEISDDVRVRTLCTSQVNQAHCFVAYISENLFLESPGLFWSNFIQKANATIFFVRRISYVTCGQNGFI